MALAESPRRPPRRWHLAPVITQGPERLESGRVLHELDGPWAVLAWQLLRAVRLWAGAASEERVGLFADGAGDRLRAIREAARPGTGVDEAVETLLSLVDGADVTTPTAVAAACRRISGWASAHGHAITALEFAQAAALADPLRSTAALDVALLARRAGEHARAETWLRRAVSVARRTAEWSIYSAALLELGLLSLDRGHVRPARRYLLRALRAATRHGGGAIRDQARSELHRLRRLPRGRR